MEKRHVSFAVAFTLLAAPIHSPDAQAQAFYAGLDLNSPTSEIPPGYQGAERTKDLGMAYSFGFFSNSFIDGGGVTRTGLVVRKRSLTTQADTLDPSDFYYRETSLQFVVDRRLVRNRKLLLTAGAGIGTTFIDGEWENGPVSSDDWGWPEGYWVFTPSIRAAYRSGYPVTVYAEAKNTFYSGDKAKTFPFQSGLVFAVGVQVN